MKSVKYLAIIFWWLLLIIVWAKNFFGVDLVAGVWLLVTSVWWFVKKILELYILPVLIAAPIILTWFYVFTVNVWNNIPNYGVAQSERSDRQNDEKAWKKRNEEFANLSSLTKISPLVILISLEEQKLTKRQLPIFVHLFFTPKKWNLCAFDR